MSMNREPLGGDKGTAGRVNGGSESWLHGEGETPLLTSRKSGGRGGRLWQESECRGFPHAGASAPPGWALGLPRLPPLFHGV